MEGTDDRCTSFTGRSALASLIVFREQHLASEVSSCVRAVAAIPQRKKLMLNAHLIEVTILRSMVTMPPRTMNSDAT